MLLGQVYASFKYRRDLAAAAKLHGVLARSRQLKYHEADELVVSRCCILTKFCVFS